MSNIVKFPKVGPTGSNSPPDKSLKQTSDTKPQKPVKSVRFFAAIVRWVWVATVLVWPVLKWIVSINVFFQAIRALYYWGNPEVNAGWTFLAHFVVLTLLTYFVSIYKPKDV
ncbi:protein kleE [Vibrio parahaemolyticus]|nr:protein kleE [Vibrio parahaemolyticus]